MSHDIALRDTDSHRKVIKLDRSYIKGYGNVKSFDWLLRGGLRAQQFVIQSSQ